MAATATPPAPPTTETRGRLPLTPGRRAALAIGAPVCLLLVAGTGLSLVADLGEARYPVSYTVPAGSSSLSVTSSGGQLTVRQAPGPATVTGTGTAAPRSSTTPASSGPASANSTRPSPSRPRCRSRPTPAAVTSR